MFTMKYYLVSFSVLNHCERLFLFGHHSSVASFLGLLVGIGCWGLVLVVFCWFVWVLVVVSLGF